MGVRCVKCGGHNTAEYLYGLPYMSEELEKNIADGKVKLGGCEVSDFDSKYHCNECDIDFGYSSKRLCDGKCTDYIEDTYYLEFGISYDNFLCVDDSKVIFEKKDDKYSVTFLRNGKKYEKEITEKVYKYNISTFFEKAYILEWENDCIREKSTINTRWNYVIKCEGMPTIENCGKDYFPPYYKQAKLRHDYYSINFERKKL